MKDLKKLDDIKKFAYAIGTKSVGNYAEVIHWIFKKKKLGNEMGYGDLWEVVVLFILGVFARSMKDRDISFWVLTDPALDKRKVDVQINHVSIQLKFGWADADLDYEREKLLMRLIFLINTPFPEPCDPIDVFRNILKTAGFSDEEIDREVIENPGFDAACECYEWFTKGLV